MIEEAMLSIGSRAFCAPSPVAFAVRRVDLQPANSCVFDFSRSTRPPRTRILELVTLEADQNGFRVESRP